MNNTALSRDFHKAGLNGLAAPWEVPWLAERVARRFGADPCQLVSAHHEGLRERAKAAVQRSLNGMRDPAQVDPLQALEWAAAAADLPPEDLVDIVWELAPEAAAEESPADMILAARVAWGDYRHIRGLRKIVALPMSCADRKSTAAQENQTERIAMWQCQDEDMESFIRPRLAAVDGQRVVGEAARVLEPTDTPPGGCEIPALPLLMFDRVPARPSVPREEPSLVEPPGNSNAPAIEFDLATEPGLLGDIARYAHASAFRPVDGFAEPAALATLAAIFGRRFCTPTGLGLNIYAVALADTGTGKESLLNGPKRLLTSAGLGAFLGPGDFTSDSAIEFSIRQRPSQLMPLDEMGKLAQALMGRNAPSFAKLAAKSLLELYTKSGPDAFWSGKQRADGLRDNAAEPVYSPTLSILGASTPAGFFDGISQESLDDGFLNRMTIFPAGKMGGRQRDAARRPVPPALVAAIQAAMDVSTAGNLSGALSRNAVAPVTLRPVDWADEAAERAIERVEDYEDTLRDEGRHGVAGRAAEQVQKIATLRALALSPSQPAVTAQDVGWAFRIVRRSIETIEAGAQKFMADTDFAALINAVRRGVAAGGDKGITRRELLRAKGVSGKEDAKVDQAIKRLEALGDIGAGVTILGPGRPARNRWRILRDDEKRAE
jgi:hypothetical protein